MPDSLASEMFSEDVASHSSAEIRDGVRAILPAFTLN
jgi:hypothetical protein